MNTRRPILCIGGANLDVIGRSAGAMVRRDSNPGLVTFSPGGVARNIAENLARMGFGVQMVAGVDTGDAGTMILESCRRAGIGVDGCRRVENAQSAYLAICDAKGDMELAVNDMSATDAINPEYLETRAPELDNSRAIVVDANLPAASLEYILQRYKVPIYAEGVSAAKVVKFKGLLERLRLIKLNRIEAAALTGIATDVPEGAFEAAVALREAGADQVVVTGGGEGVHWADGCGAGFFQVMATGFSASEDFVPAGQACHTGDANGAGDAFMAGLVAADVRGRSIERALEWGDSLAALTLQSSSAVSPQVSPGFLKALEENSV